MTMKCHICNKKALGRYTVDMDIQGLTFCKKHKAIIGSVMLWAVLGLSDIAEKLIKDAKAELVRKPVKAKPLKARSKNAPLKGKRE